MINATARITFVNICKQQVTEVTKFVLESVHAIIICHFERDK